MELEDVDPEPRAVDRDGEIQGLPRPQHSKLVVVEKALTRRSTSLVGPDLFFVLPDPSMVAEHRGMPAGDVDVGDFRLNGRADELFEFFHDPPPLAFVLSFPRREITACVTQSQGTINFIFRDTACARGKPILQTRGGDMESSVLYFAAGIVLGATAPWPSPPPLAGHGGDGRGILDETERQGAGGTGPPQRPDAGCLQRPFREALSRNSGDFLGIAGETLSRQAERGTRDLEGKKELIDQALRQMRDDLLRVRELISTLERTGSRSSGS
jgi:hypothetical protein